MKKILAVATALVLAISSLCVFVVADSGSVVAYATSTNTTSYSFSYSDYLSSYSTGDTITIVATVESDSKYSSGSVGANATSGWASTSYGGSQTIDWTESGSVYTATVTLEVASGYDSPYGGGQVQFWYVGGSYIKVTSLTINGTETPTYSISVDSNVENGSVTASATESAKGATIAVTATPASGYKFSAWKVTDANGSTVKVDTSSGTFSMPASAVEVSAVFVEDGSSSTPVTTGTSSAGVIYVNEEYHGLLLNMNGKVYLLNYPHEVDANGYCTVCGEYVGGETESEVITIDGVEYVEAFVYDTTIASGNWNKVTIGDSTLAAALNTEGAKLVITRDTETVVSFADGGYDKFMLGKDDSTYVQLGTGYHTSADEASVDVDCTSDDCYVVVYDGATVYAALSDAGLADLSSYVLISNTSASYNITSIQVLIPVGTVVTETVDVDEPAEDTNSETEDDELDVDDTDAEEVTETNPTTGAVLALVPMAIAGFAVVVASKRK